MYRQKIESLDKQFKIALDTDKRIKDSYIQNSEKEYQELMKRMEAEKDRNERELKKLEDDNQAKIRYEEARNKQLEEEIKALH